MKLYVLVVLCHGKTGTELTLSAFCMQVLNGLLSHSPSLLEAARNRWLVAYRLVVHIWALLFHFAFM